MKCIYCGDSGPFTDEHVLTRAFSGPGEDWVLRDLVCDTCNNRFSRYERRWVGQPGLSEARIAHGPVSRTREGRAFQSHPSENWFLKAHDDPIYYEVDVLLGMESRLRVQVIATPDDVVVSAGHQDDLIRFQNAYTAFTQCPEITIQKRLQKSSRQYRVAVLDLEGPVRIAQIELRDKPAKAWLDRFPNGFFSGEQIRTDPRMSVDPTNRLRFRAKSLAEIPALLAKVFAKGKISSDGRSIQGGHYTLICREAADIPGDSPTYRAIAKTAANFAIAELGANWIAAPEFRPLLDFCIGKTNGSAKHPVVGIMPPNQLIGVRAIDTVSVDRHALALVSNGVRVVCLIRLYGGPVYRVHLGPAPAGSVVMERSVHIDYNGCGRVSPPP
ncbi:hypothetical protein [Fluviibacter phosphoraccumulans]|uniref:hypothetical protein n=1 Tax=Fluviibacter phosphoraccumulans TaxID=1751046 RepID=UPI0010B910D8|nr:hypothetical protein [Fluviibacter phosphoraccumulans]